MSRIHVNFSKVLGPVKPMHGVNNGPVTYGGLTDTVASFKEAGIPIVRLHDPDWPNPYQVDIPKIFPDWDKDENDPASYRFSQTDDLIDAIYRSGAEPLYRLGVSIEHIREKIYAVKPKDFEKWSRICVHVIKHYNEGWNNGFHFGIKYWEIWNEADGHIAMWNDGTPEDYYRLYITASKIIKEACPDVLVGGYAGCTVDNPTFMTGFFKAISEAKAPLDFFSWHKYSSGSNVTDYKRAAEVARHYLVEYGYPDVPSILDEWNYMVPGAWEGMHSRNSKKEKRYAFEQQKTMPGCSFAVATMIQMQNSPMDMAVYYDAQPHMIFCGLFDMYGVEQKTFYGFKAYNYLYRAGKQVDLFGTESNVFSMAATDGKTNYVLLSNHESDDEIVDVELNAIAENSTCNMYLLDNEHDLELYTTDYLVGTKALKRVPMKRNSVVVLEIK